MKIDFIIRIIIYMIIVRIIISRINKRKNTRSNKKENSIPKRYDRQEKSGIEEEQRDKKNNKYNKKIDINNFRSSMSKSNKPISPEERMKQREKELENMNKR